MRSAGFTRLAGIGLGLLLCIAQRSTAQGGGALPTCTGWRNCSPSRAVCASSDQTAFFWPAVVSDFPDGVSSDGRGPYVPRADGVMWSLVETTAGLRIDLARDSVTNPRTLVVNLNHPVPGGGGVPRGVITDGDDNGLYAQWRRVGDTVQSLHSIPVGQTVAAAMMNVLFHIKGRFHILQMGPQPFGHCHIPVTSVNGTGTSSATIFRESATKWVMDLPPGSVGRLFDLTNTTVHAVDKGLYSVRLHYEIGTTGVQTGILAGRVINADGSGPVEGAGVNALLPNGAILAGTVTRADGTYRIPVVPIGTYQVQIRAGRFSTYEASKVTIRQSETTTLDAELTHAIQKTPR